MGSEERDTGEESSPGGGAPGGGDERADEAAATDYGHGSETLGDRYANEMLQVMEAVLERFGTTDPPEDELRPFLREWLAGQGHSEDEIDEIMRGV